MIQIKIAKSQSFDFNDIWPVLLSNYNHLTDGSISEVELIIDESINFKANIDYSWLFLYMIANRIVSLPYFIELIVIKVD